MSSDDTTAIEGQVPETESNENISSPFVTIQVETPDHSVVTISNVGLVETLSFVKQGLLEFVETSHYTNFNFAIEGESGEQTVVNEFADIGNLAVHPESGSVNLRMIPEIYDARKCRVHLKRTKELLSSPPFMTGQANGRVEVTNHSQPVKKTNNALPTADEVFTSAKLNDFYASALFRTGHAEKKQVMSANVQKLPGSCITNLSLSAWNPPPPARLLQGDLLYIEVITADEGIFHVTAVPTGFYVNKSNRHHFDPTPAANPHFSHELFETLLGMSNALSRSWDEVLLSVQQQQEGGHNEENNSFVRSNALDGIATMFAQGKGDKLFQHPQWNVPQAQIEKQALAEITAAAAPATTVHADDHVANSKHTPDASRVQDYLCDSFGSEDRGAPREWNEEIQSVRAIVAESMFSKILKAKYAYRVYTEFFEACKLASMALVDGQLSPINPMDPENAHVFVYNSIFFSRAIDTKEAFKLSKGDEAARKSCGHDLNSQRIIESLEIKGLSTVLSCIVDYKGERIVGQTIIPGVLMSGAGAARLMYGAIDFGKRIACKTEAAAIMESLGTQLLLPTRQVAAVPVEASKAANSSVTSGNSKIDDVLSTAFPDQEASQASIRTDNEDEVVPVDSLSVPHVGPVEGKLLKGADGRLYALEMMRLTPRDANYVREEIGGTGLIAADKLAKADRNLGMVCILRHELISAFIQKKVNTSRQELLLEAVAEATKTEEDDKEAEGEHNETSSKDISTKAAALAQKLQEITNDSVKFQVSPNCFLEVNENSEEDSATPTAVLRSDVDETVAALDESNARELAVFLKSVVLPAITHDVRINTLQPLDNSSMIGTLHASGVNIRYLGQLAELAQLQEKEDVDMAAQNKQRVHLMPHYWLEMLEVEMLSRATKHLVNSYFRTDAMVKAAPSATIISVLNHIFGNSVAKKVEAAAEKNHDKTNSAAPVAATPAPAVGTSGKNKKKKDKKAVASQQIAKKSSDVLFTVPNAAENRTSTLTSLLELVASRYLYTCTLANLAEENFLSSRISPLFLLRRVCQLCGLRVATREYDFSCSTPFSLEDLIGLVPCARSSTGMGTLSELPVLPEIREMLATSRKKLNDGQMLEAFEISGEAANWSQQITGPIHKDLVSSLDQTTSVLIMAGDLSLALSTASRSLTLSVQLDGLDSHEALKGHIRIAAILLGLQSVALNNGEESNTATTPENQALADAYARAAADHLLTAKYLIEVMGGPRHPELVNIYYKLGSVYSDKEEYNVGLTCLVEAKSRVSDLAQQAVIAQTIAEVLVRMGHLQPGLAEQRQCLKLMQDIFGETDEKTVEAKARVEKYLRAFTERNVKIGREIQQAQSEAMLQAEQRANATLLAGRNRPNDEIVKEPHNNNNNKKSGSKKRIVKK